MHLSWYLREFACALGVLLSSFGHTACASPLSNCHQPPSTVKSIEVQVGSFGAKPDDGIDDSDAIQNAINSLKSGGRLVFTPGIYDYDKSLKIQKEYVQLIGKGAVLHGTSPESQAIIVQADGVTIEGFTLTATTDRRRNTKESARLVVYGATTKRGWISGTVFKHNKIIPGGDQNSSSSAGILISRAEHFLIERNDIRRTLADGIHVTGGSRYGSVIGNTVSETGDDMIAVVSYMGKQWRNHQAQNQAWVVDQAALSQVRDVLIEDNVVSGQYWGRGISIVGGRSISIIRNKISNTTLAAGVLVAHEDVYNTYGAQNILIQDNDISDVQTLSAAYMPSGIDFSKLHLRRASGITTGHAAIEIHSLAREDEARDANLTEAVSVNNIAVIRNRINRTKADGIRVGISSPGELIGNVSLIENSLTNIGGQGISYRGKGGATTPLACVNNLLDRKPFRTPVCEPLRIGQETAKGADREKIVCKTTP